MRNRELIQKELTAIAAANNGVLMPPQVWQWAQANPDSELHGEFEWDEHEAAKQAWTQRARDLIRVHVRYEEVSQVAEKVGVREWVSLPSDRQHGGGYRSMDDVLTNADLMAEMLTDCLRELERLQRKYGHLEALRDVWDAIGKRD